MEVKTDSESFYVNSTMSAFVIGEMTSTTLHKRVT